tara:strand:+ start:469 stop:630 length:162 start_codon:yes stop_codon:yes gene_type:complete
MNYFKVNQNTIDNENENINYFFDIVVSKAVEGWNAGDFNFKSADFLSKHHLKK